MVFRTQITLPSHCAREIELTAFYVIVACPALSNGFLSIYQRNLAFTITLIVTERGTVNNYTIIGNSITMFEHNLNHSTLFYTSNSVSNNISYTHVNTMQLLRFTSGTTVIVRYKLVVNQFRHKINDTFAKGSS